MKHNKELDMTQPLELTLVPEWNAGHNFVITGNAEAVMPYAEQAQKQDARMPRLSRVNKRIGHSAIIAPKRAVEGFVGRLSVNVKTVAYDKIHGTHMYDMLQEKRADERNVAFATSIGLLSLTESTCVKHQHAVDKLAA